MKLTWVKNEDETVNIGTKASVMRLFEVFLETAPQMILQLYIMMQVNQDISQGNFTSGEWIRSITEYDIYS